MTNNNQANNSDYIAQKEVEAYLTVVGRQGELSGLDLAIKGHYEKYLQSHKKSILRSLAKEVRVIVRDTFSERELENYRTILGGKDVCKEMVDAILSRGRIVSQEEFSCVISFVDRVVSFGDEDGLSRLNSLNQMLAAYEVSAKNGRDK